MNKVDILLERFETLTFQESQELKDKMKETFSLTYPEPPGDVSAPLPIEQEEKWGAVNMIAYPPEQKMNVLKTLRETFSFTLQECKQKVDSLPSLLVDSADVAKFQELQEKLGPYGVTLKHG